MILKVWLTPVGSFSKLLSDVSDGKLPALKNKKYIPNSAAYLEHFHLYQF